MSHNAEVKLCNLHQFAEAFSGIACCKIFCPSFMFHHFTIKGIWLMLVLDELKQVLVLVKQFFLINRNVSRKQILLTWSNIFSFSWLQTVESCQRINSANKVVHFSRCATQDLYNTDTSDMNNTQSLSLPSLSPCVFSLLGLLNISHLLSNNNQKWLQMPYCLKQSSLREFPKKRFGTTVGLSMDMKYECEAGTFEAFLAS